MGSDTSLVYFKPKALQLIKDNIDIVAKEFYKYDTYFSIINIGEDKKLDSPWTSDLDFYVTEGEALITSGERNGHMDALDESEELNRLGLNRSSVIRYCLFTNLGESGYNFLTDFPANKLEETFNSVKYLKKLGILNKE